jgi:hypothetical protein
MVCRFDLIKVQDIPLQLLRPFSPRFSFRRAPQVFAASGLKRSQKFAKGGDL